MNIHEEYSNIFEIIGRLGHVIDGATVQSDTSDTIDVFNPTTSNVLATVPRGTQADVSVAVASAKTAYETRWKRIPPRERSDILSKCAKTIAGHENLLAPLEAMDTGKPISAARRDVRRAADYFRYYAGICEKVYGETVPKGKDYVCFSQIEPLGVVGHITPWNVPLSTAARGVAPSLACGNTVVIKPAEEAPLSTLYLGQLLLGAGLPPGVCNVVNGYGDAAGAALALHQDVNHLTFTGSVETGKSVMSAAASHICSVTMELGGKSPMIVLRDADLNTVVEDAFRQIVSNAGQICSAGMRLVVHESLRGKVVSALLERLQEVEIGPWFDDPDMGPLISKKQVARVSSHVDAGRKRGRSILCGGSEAKIRGYENGFFYQPTIIDDVPIDDPLSQEEIFGPVMIIQTFDNDEGAMEIANGTPYGLAAGLYGKDIDKVMALSRDIRAGQVFINEYHSAGDTVPFGGFGQSGIGREKGLAAIANYTAPKFVTVRIHREAAIQ